MAHNSITDLIKPNSSQHSTSHEQIHINMDKGNGRMVVEAKGDLIFFLIAYPCFLFVILLKLRIMIIFCVFLLIRPMFELESILKLFQKKSRAKVGKQNL